MLFGKNFEEDRVIGHSGHNNNLGNAASQNLISHGNHQ